jgi:hypothetical protein
MLKINNETLLIEVDEQKQFQYNFFKKTTIGVIISFLVIVLYFNSEAQKHKDTIKYQEAKIKDLNLKISYLENFKKDSNVEYSIFRKSINVQLSEFKEKKLRHLYFKYKQLISNHNIPANLVWYIAIKESNLDVNAKNPKSSATGLFQFINSTWKEMCKRGGMDISGRFNEEKQVKVMLTYLDFLYNKYGNWKDVHKEYVGNVIMYKLPYYK